MLYITSWIIRLAIKMRWWNIVSKVLEFKKHKLATKMRKQIQYDTKTR